jgi:hypothetical protein
MSALVSNAHASVFVLTPSEFAFVVVGTAGAGAAEAAGDAGGAMVVCVC